MNSRTINIRKYAGGVERDVYKIDITGHPEMVAIIANDTVAVSDQVRCRIRHRGQISAQLAEFFLNATEDIIPNFLLPTDGRLPANILLGEYCRPVPVKFIMRRYLTGGLYDECTQANDAIPLGMLDNNLLLVPVVKTIGGGYEPITEDEILDCGYLTSEEMLFIREKCIELFRRGECLASKVGLTLVDTKFEFGWGGYGNLMLIDELLTPDCSGYWQAHSGGNPPRMERLGEYLSSWMERQAKRRGVDVSDVVLTPYVRREAYCAYTAIFLQMLGFPFFPDRAAKDSMRALRNYLEFNFE